MATYQPRILVVVAHPDDETMIGGTIAKYSLAGAEVTLICTTDGSGGLGADAAQGQLASIRRKELECSCDILGISRVELFEDSEPFSEPLSRDNYAAVLVRHEERIGSLLEEVSPQVVVTFGPEGVTGHPTHIMLGAATDRAFKAWRSENASLLHIAFDEERIRGIDAWFDEHPDALARYEREVQMNPRLGAPRPEFFPVEDSQINCVIQVSDWADLRHRAIACHRSQGGVGGFIEALSAGETEAFVDVSRPGGVRRDLFA